MPGNPVLDKPDSTNPPSWATYEVRLVRADYTLDSARELADILAKRVYEMIGSSAGDGNKWQVDWIQYQRGYYYPESPIFMLRFENTSNGIMVRLALGELDSFALIDSGNLPTTL